MKLPNILTPLSRESFPSLVLTICIALLGLFAAWPTLLQSLEDPNLIAYFNGDESYLVDLIWYYFSGEKRLGFQGEVDYGLLMVYISDLVKFLPNHSLLTPSAFAFILRIMHLSAWVLCLFAFWQLIKKHFGTHKVYLLSILLLGTAPSFPYYTVSSKPDYICLLFIIIGLNYALKLIEHPSLKNVIITLSLAVVSTLIKFAGIFVIPAVMAALFISYKRTNQKLFPQIKNLWIFPTFLALILGLSPFFGFSLYHRLSTGLTYFQEFGFIESFVRVKMITPLYLLVIVLFGVSFFLHLIQKREKKQTEIQKTFFMIFSDGIWLMLIFVITFCIFGFRWFLHPEHFINTYAQNIFMDFSGGFELRDAASAGTFVTGTIQVIFERIYSIRFILVLFIIYIFCETRFLNKKLTRKETIDKLSCKRMVLLAYLIPFVIILFTPGRFTEHHMLPYFVAIFLLAGANIDLIRRADIFQNQKIKLMLLCILILTMINTIVLNGLYNLNWGLHMRQRHQDIAFVAGPWLKKNIQKDKRILSDYPTKIYIPNEFKNVIFFPKKSDLRQEDLFQVIENFKPDYIYRNLSLKRKGSPLNLLKSKYKLKLKASFKAKDKDFNRFKNNHFVLYKIQYN